MKNALMAAFANGWAWSGLLPVVMLALDHHYALGRRSVKNCSSLDRLQWGIDSSSFA
jgi:hypothetical protein